MWSPPRIERFIQKVELHQDRIRRVISLSSLLQNNNQPIFLTQNITMHMTRRGVEMRMIIGEIVLKLAGPVLIKTLARALSWYDEFASGQC